MSQGKNALGKDPAGLVDVKSLGSVRGMRSQGDSGQRAYTEQERVVVRRSSLVGLVVAVATSNKGEND